MFRISPAVIAALCLTALPGHVPAQEPPSPREVTYYGDRHVRVPAEISRIATAWEAQNSIIAMLGYGDRIVATTRIARSIPLFRKFVPSITDAALTAGSDGLINVEELMVLKPDILFVSSALPSATARQLDAAGIAVAAFRANSMDALLERIGITGELLGPDAAAIAERYERYFDDNRKRVADRLERVPEDRRLKVYLASGAPLTTSGRPSLNQDWMDLGGAINVAEGWFSGQPFASGTASIEEVVAADPDVIIAMRAEDAEDIRNDPKWRKIRAVREGRVYANPRGLFWWSRETSEEALQFLWLAGTLYPDAFADIDMEAETRAFYRSFYRIKLSDEEISEILLPAG